jgi:hypothetical protein
MPSHADLVERAAVWLAHSMRCPLVITELRGGYGEEPDAIGFTSTGGSILVECKASKSDFEKDKWKSSRRTLSGLGMGNRRFYLVPKELLNHVMLNRPPGWGVLVAYKTRVETKHMGEWIKDVNKTKETGMLVSSLRRLAGEKHPLTGVNIRHYTIDGPQNPKATIGIEKEKK